MKKIIKKFIPYNFLLKILKSRYKDTECIYKIEKTDDVSNLVYFLVSDKSNFITGQNIIVDGGRSLALKSD